MTPRTARLARGWLAGSYATALAALSHSVAGGGLPSPLAIAAGMVFGGMLGTFALSARPSLPRLLVAVGATQLAFHVGFSTLGTANSAAVSTAAHLHGAAPMVATAGHAHPASPGMWFAHGVAALLTLALLRGAERAVWRMLAELVRLVVAPFRRPVAAPVAVRPRVSLAPPAPARLLGRTLLSVASRRGPPLPVAP